MFSVLFILHTKYIHIHIHIHIYCTKCCRQWTVCLHYPLIWYHRSNTLLLPLERLWMLPSTLLMHNPKEKEKNVYSWYDIVRHTYTYISSYLHRRGENETVQCLKSANWYKKLKHNALIHSYTHTLYTHTLISHALIHSYTHKLVHSYTHIYKHTYAHVFIQSNTQTHTYAYWDVQTTHTYIQ